MDTANTTGTGAARRSDRFDEEVVRSAGAAAIFTHEAGATDETDHRAGATGGDSSAVVRVRLARTERVSAAEARASYEIHLPGRISPITGTLALPFPSSMSELDRELRTAVLDVLAEAGLPRQLVDTLVYD